MTDSFPILLVDDDPLLENLLTLAARTPFPEASFLEVFSTRQAIDYLNQLAGDGPRLVLLDINVEHRQSGFNLLKYLRDNSLTRLIPVSMLTVSMAQADVEMAYANGVTSYRVQPEELGGWVSFLGHLRQYWLLTVTLPRVNFFKMNLIHFSVVRVDHVKLVVV